MGCRRSAWGPPGPTSGGRVAARGHRRPGLEGGDARAERARASPGRCRRPGRASMETPCPAPPRPGLDASAGQVRFRHDHRRGALTALLHHRRDGDPGDRPPRGRCGYSSRRLAVDLLGAGRRTPDRKSPGGRHVTAVVDRLHSPLRRGSRLRGPPLRRRHRRFQGRLRAAPAGGDDGRRGGAFARRPSEHSSARAA